MLLIDNIELTGFIVAASTQKLSCVAWLNVALIADDTAVSSRA